MKKLIFILSIIISFTLVTVAFAADIWATSLVDSYQGPPITGSIDPGRSNPNAVLGEPDNDGVDGTTFFSLGDEGFVVVKLSEPVSTSLEVYEATWKCKAGYANEIANVSVSQDGINWTYLGTADNLADKTCYNNAGFISSLDLDGQCIQYVRVEDFGESTERDGFDVDAIVGRGACQLVIQVDIDVKPGSFPSCFNSNGHGVIPVAIFGAQDFDVSLVDIETVALDGAPVTVRKRTGKPMFSFSDINSDSLLDMVVQIDDIGGYTPADTFATLTGSLNNGTPFEGVGDICITR